MDIPDEVRAAVLAERCERYGHVPDISQLLGNDPTVYPSETTIRVRAKQADTIPHVFCKQCGWVWLIGADGANYDAAEDSLNDLLAPKHRRKLRREVRRDRAAAEAAATEKEAAERAAAEKTTHSPRAGTPDTTSAPTPAPTP